MPSETIKAALDRLGLLARVALSPAIDELLTGLLSADKVPDGNDVTGLVTVSYNKSLGFLALDLTPPPMPVEYRLITDPGPSFRFWLELNKAAPAQKLFDLAAGAAGVVLKPAAHDPSNDELLVAAPGDVRISGAAVAILIEGRAGQAATLRLSPTVGQPPGIVELQLVPPTVLIGDTGFGLEFPEVNGKAGAFVIDDAADAAPGGQTVINGAVIATRADDPSWRGLAVRHARFYLPDGVPLLGGHAVDAYVEVGTAPGEGIDLVIATKIPPKDSRPGIDVTIECRDPSATGLQDFIPTLVEAAMTLPLDGMHQDSPGGGFTMLAGKPVIARARFARSVAEPETRITLAVESQGEHGVLAVIAPGGGPAAKVLITAAALATAIVADKAPEGADTGGVVLHALLAAALGLSSCLKDKGGLTIHKVEISSTGHGLPVGDQVKLLVDYSVDVVVKPINVGALSVEMAEEQPMRVRNRNVGLRINLSNPAASGVQTIELDFSAADMEIEDPGKWKVQSPASLFDILGTRSGRGSTWLEVDLRFKLNLGPVRVSGATIRATLEDSGSISASLRGLDASLDVPGVIKGGGALAMLPDGGFTAALDVSVVPLNLATDGFVRYQPHGDSFLLFVQLGVDLPGPIPIANTGLGIYGIGGAFGFNARPTPPGPAEPDPIGYQLRWNPTAADAFDFVANDVTVGAQAVFGTVPDLGFSFSTRAALFITVPDVVVRGSLWASVLSPRMRVSDQPSEGGDPGLSFLGVVVVDPADGVTVGLKGQLNMLPLLKITIPLGAHFPTGKTNSDDWYIYLGADGYRDASPPDGRALGPMRAEVLPDILPTTADAYLMFRGRGIQRWPRGGPINVADGLVIAFGFGFETTIGAPPIAWAEVHASADILIATHPLLLAGFGAAGGSLNLGPFSIGVDATLALLLAENADPFIHVRLCGHIDLFFTEIEGCVEISINSAPTLKVPPPDVHPLDDVVNGQIAGNLAYLIDDKYRRVGFLASHPNDAEVVWPDTLLHLCFAISPALAPGWVVKAGAVTQFSSIDNYPTGIAASPVGSDMLKYDWTLTGLGLYDVTDDVNGPGTLVPGPMSAAWQAGKDGDPGKRPQAGDLVLLTYQGDLFLNRLADGGKDLSNDPIEDATTACQREVKASEGWAVGFIATGTGAAFSLPADPITPDPCVSRFTATLTESTSILPDLPLTMGTAALIPPPFDYTAPALEMFTPPIELERMFSGALDLSVVTGPPFGDIGFKRVQPFQAARIVPSEAITLARIWLTVDGPIEPGVMPPVGVVDNLGNAWALTERKDLPSGRIALRFAPRTADWIASVDVRWLLGRRLAVLGVGGITATAQAAAAVRNAAAAAEDARQAAAAANQPQKDTDTTGDGVHAVLKPGRTYRLDVAMEWAGSIYQQDEDGTKHLADQVANQTTYLPQGANPADPPKTARSYFFKTAPKPKGAPAARVTALTNYGSDTYFKALRTRRDLFEPEMLTRFLLGYTPAQTEMARFGDDPVNAHFSAAHVITLAKEYGYSLILGLRRVDVPGADGNTIELTPNWVALKEPSLLTGAVDQRKIEASISAICKTPTPGATLTAVTPLSTSAWYEVYALAKSDDDRVLDGRLEGVTFRTSRWRNPADMLAGLGFPVSPSAASGDIELKNVPALGAAVIDGSDADFEAALDALGLEGWPPASHPRVSLLWLRQDADAGPSWLCAGLLLESPEPVHREGRVTLNGLRLIMPPPPAGVFDIRRSDRTRSRLLWICSTPFAPHFYLQKRLFQPPRRVSPSLALELLDDSTKAVLTGYLALPVVPSFAGEA